MTYNLGISLLTKPAQYDISAPTMGPSYCRDVVWWAPLSVNSDKNGLVAITKRRKLPGFFEPRLFWEDFTPLYVSQVTRGTTGFAADLEGARGC